MTLQHPTTSSLISATISYETYCAYNHLQKSKGPSSLTGHCSVKASASHPCAASHMHWWPHSIRSVASYICIREFPDKRQVITLLRTVHIGLPFEQVESL